MAITQTAADTSEQDFKDLMVYNINTHRFIPTTELVSKYGINISYEAGDKRFTDAELRNISDTIYDYATSHMPHRNQEIMLAKLAENAHDEQETLARAFGYMAQFVSRGGDETSHRSGINFETGVYVSSDVMDEMSLGLQVKRILKNGNGKEGGGVWFEGEYCFEVADITDLVYGVDY